MIRWHALTLGNMSWSFLMIKNKQSEQSEHVENGFSAFGEELAFACAGRDLFARCSRFEPLTAHLPSLKTRDIVRSCLSQEGVVSQL